MPIEISPLFDGSRFANPLPPHARIQRLQSAEHRRTFESSETAFRFRLIVVDGQTKVREQTAQPIRCNTCPHCVCPPVYDGAMESTRRALLGGAIGAIGAAQLLAQRNADDRPKAPADVKPGSITYEDVAYPHPVQFLPLALYGQDVKLAYMDVAPAGTPNGPHCDAVPWNEFRRILFLRAHRAFAQRRLPRRRARPDRLRRSSKPIMPYNFHDMAANSRKLLQTLGIAKVAIVGHSMGGMLTARFSATQGDVVERAVIYNPIGTTDVRFGGQKWRNAEEIIASPSRRLTIRRISRHRAPSIDTFAQPGACDPSSKSLFASSMLRPSVPIGRAGRWSAR